MRKIGILGSLSLGALMLVAFTGPKAKAANSVGLLGSSMEGYKVDTLSTDPSFKANCYLIPSSLNTQVAPHYPDGSAIEVYTDAEDADDEYLYNAFGTTLFFPDIFDSGYDYLFITDWSGDQGGDLKVSSSFYVPQIANATGKLFLSTSSQGFTDGENTTCSLTLGESFDTQFLMYWNTGYCSNFGTGDRFFSSAGTYWSEDEDGSIFFDIDQSRLGFNYLEILDKDSFFNKYKLADTTPPTFTSNDNYISNVSSPLSREYILSTIKASDETDGACTPYIKETNYVPNVLGKYYMIIGAKDKSGNEGTKNIWINVVDIDAPTASVKVFNAVNTTKSSVDDIIAKSITASDNYFTSFKYSVLSDNYSANYKVAGNYEINVRITEARDNGLYVDKTIRVENADKLAPTFVTKPEVINAINNKLLTTNEIIAKFKATDESSNVAYSLVGYENYKNNYGKAGTYNLGIKATDTSGNSTEFNFNIKNADGIAPTITGDGRMEVSYTKKLSIDDIIKTLNASDESATNLVINVVADNYSSVYDTLGEHQITFKTNDGVNDSTIFTKTIVVIDDVNPVLVGPEKIEISNKEIDQLTEDEIKQKFSATDKSDVALSLIDTNNYLTNKGKVGEYNFTITATDSSNNKSSISFQIKVSDEIAPVLSINDSSYVIVLQEGESLTIEQIKNILGQIGAIENVEEIENIESAYFETYSAGEYECKIQMKSGEVYRLAIRNAARPKTDEAPEEEKVGFLKKVWNAICSFFRSIKRFFYNLGSFVANIKEVFNFESDVKFIDRVKNAYHAWENKNKDTKEPALEESSEASSTLVSA